MCHTCAGGSRGGASARCGLVGRARLAACDEWSRHVACGGPRSQRARPALAAVAAGSTDGHCGAHGDGSSKPERAWNGGLSLHTHFNALVHSRTCGQPCTHLCRRQQMLTRRQGWSCWPGRAGSWQHRESTRCQPQPMSPEGTVCTRCCSGPQRTPTLRAEHSHRGEVMFQWVLRASHRPLKQVQTLIRAQLVRAHTCAGISGGGAVARCGLAGRARRAACSVGTGRVARRGP